MSLTDKVLPSEWHWVPLKHLTTVLRRGSTPSYSDDGAVRVISQASNQRSGLDWSRTRFHEHTGNPEKLKGFLRPGDILINSTGRGTLGRVGYFTDHPDHRPCMADTHVTVARTEPEKWDSRFAFYYLSSNLFYDYIYSTLVVGATNQIELNNERLAAAPATLPPLEEQRRIASFLDSEAAQIDQLTKKRQAQFSALEERANAVISEMLFPGILHSPAGRYPWTWLPDPSDNVPMVRLGYVCRLQTGLTVDGSRNTTDDDVTRPYLRVANVQADHVDLESVTSITVPRHIAERSTLRPGDVLMTEGGDLDKLGRGTVWHGELPGALHQNHVFALRPQLDILSPDYLALLTQSLHGRCYFESTGTRSTNLASTNSSKVLSFPIPLPSLERQKQLTKEIRESLEAVKRARNALQHQLTLLSERRQALITAAVTGQLDGRG